MDIKEIAKMTSREAHLAATFNYASMAYNNNFFFDSIASNCVKLVKNGKEEIEPIKPYEHMPPLLRKGLEASFGSLDNLRTEMIEQANAMFGPGFVWLVRHQHARGLSGPSDPYRILVTYQAGSPFPEAHWRRQSMDMNSVAGTDDRMGNTVSAYFETIARHQGRVPQMHGSGADILHARRDVPPNSATVVPVLCVNTWEHAWMFDWGVGNKRRYLEAWWRAVHWGKVWERAAEVGEREMRSNPEVGTDDPGLRRIPPTPKAAQQPPEAQESSEEFPTQLSL